MEPRSPAPIHIRAVLTVGFGLLVILIAFAGFTALERATEIYSGISALHEADHRTEELLGALRSDLQISAVAIRDYLLDPSADPSSTRLELRRLSQQLVHAQEEERRSLSRELHDQVGQLLTAVRIGIGNLEDALGSCSSRVTIQIDQTRRIVEQALRCVRDLAMGLRPAMLDDLGLGAALEWQARQHARLCGVPVSVDLDGSLEELSDDQRTCIYRVVQEALNNIAKHAAATHIQIEVARRGGLLSIMIRDNGVGFATGNIAKGLGIIGIKERVRQLGGHVSIDSAAGQGTALVAVIPLAETAAKAHA